MEEIDGRILVGPISLFDIERLKAILDKAGASYKVLHNEELVKQYHERNIGVPPKAHPTYEGPAEFMHFEFSKEHYPLLQRELELLGETMREDRDPNDDPKEYLCTECKYVSETQGTCPTHHLALLEYSEWVSFQQNRKLPLGPLIKIIFVIAVVSFFVYIAIRMSGK